VITIRGHVTIATERCKGCELCLPACKPGVLTMSRTTNAMGFPYPELSAGCTGCNACHEVCPDFVFEVFKYDTPMLVRDAAHEDPAP
jgi:2-oxoglutarate ferredoxin oxidoreductase subunit delta